MTRLYFIRSYVVVVLATAFLACSSSKSPIDCPDGTNYRKAKLMGRVSAVCVNADQKVHGPTLSWQEVDGAEKKAFTGSYEQGVAHGVFQQWSPTGELLGSYEMDKGSGTLVEWHANGSKSLTTIYEKGKKVGPAIAWHDNGTKREEGSYEAGVKHGKWVQWDAEGKETRVEEYDKGKLIEAETAAAAEK